MKTMIAIIILFLSGCTLTQVVRKGAEANDKVLDAAVFTICHGASVGAVRRKFGKNTVTMAAWVSLCSNTAFQPFRAPPATPAPSG